MRANLRQGQSRPQRSRSFLTAWGIGNSGLLDSRSNSYWLLNTMTLKPEVKMNQRANRSDSGSCWTFDENIVVRNHPLDLLGPKALPENIPSVFERFFNYKLLDIIACLPLPFNAAYHKVIRFQKSAFFLQKYRESVLLVKREKNGR